MVSLKNIYKTTCVLIVLVQCALFLTNETWAADELNLDKPLENPIHFPLCTSKEYASGRPVVAQRPSCGQREESTVVARSVSNNGFFGLKPDQEVTERGILVKQSGESPSIVRQFELRLDAGYRKDNLDWNEAGNSVNILSELKWENLEIVQISAAAKLDLPSGWNLRGMLAYGNIRSGSNQDSDYNGNNRTLEWSRSNNKGGGEVRDASLGLGKTLRLSNYAGGDFLFFTPLAGLSIHQQNLTMTGGFQTLPATGAYPGLDSSYDAQWQGPWIGIDTLFEWGGDWSLNATVEHHWADYSAHANWNLRDLSFVHTAKGRGVSLVAGATYHVSHHWDARFAVQVQQWGTNAGIDQTTSPDGSVAYYRLNSVNWNSRSFNFGMVRYF